MEEYNDIHELLTPRRYIQASESLRRRINRSMETSHPQHAKLIWMYVASAFTAAAICAAIIMSPSRLSAQKLLASAKEVFANTDRIEMTVHVRTSPVENFSYIDPTKDFVPHHITVNHRDSMTVWNVDKTGRIATHINDTTYYWLPDLNIGWKSTESPENVLDYLSIFINPEKILDIESNASATATSVKEHDGKLIITIHDKPHGNLLNPYMLNKSVTLSENIRQYVIDASTHRLKAATVTISDNNRKVEILHISDIKYGPEATLIPSLPRDIRFIDTITQSERGAFPELSAAETATVVLNAFHDWNTDIIYPLIGSTEAETMYKNKYAGATLINIGTPFNSGNESIFFIPYTIRLSDGTIRHHNLALQRLTNGRWIMSGGL